LESISQGREGAWTLKVGTHNVSILIRDKV
jgi:hypothetical protein